MNERIKELYGQAGLTMNNPLAYEQWYLDSLEKFALLIVRECAGVCDDERDSTDSEFGKLVAESCALKIMEHFGVEE